MMIQRGMHVEILDSGSADVWTVLDRHPDKGCWWLHRWDGAQWKSTYANYRQLNQVPVTAGV
jgi:hypothetical protein